MKAIFLILAIAFGISAAGPNSASAAVKVAFLEVTWPNGSLVQLERDGQFAHVAIFYQGKWLHAHPLRGVELITADELQRFGTVFSIVRDPTINALDETLVQYAVGRPYDYTLNWSDESAFYNAELVGKLLNIVPLPMTFDSPDWPKEFSSLAGNLGLSPDDIFNALVARSATVPEPSSGRATGGGIIQEVLRRCDSLLGDLD